ncbi:MAG TPA: nucleotidyltransferase family protein [Candidatus Binatia bacterium]
MVKPLNVMPRLPFLKIPILGPLSTILPNPAQTRLLRACLWSGKLAAIAWREWSREIADPAAFLRQEKDGIKGLLPLLFDSLQVNDVSVEGNFCTYLRTAYLRDELRSRTYARICREVIKTFAAAGIPAALLKGAALAETCYKSPALQHAHYLDILIKERDLNGAVETLRPCGFTCAGVATGSELHNVELVHDSGLPLVLHRRLFHLPFYSVNMEDIWARSRTHEIGGIPTQLLCPADNLFHICGSVFDAERYQSLRWVCDAWFIVRQYSNLDWGLLINRARRSHTVLPVFITLSYLAEVLAAPIPAGVLSRLRDAASKADRIGREAALFSIQKNARGGLMKILRNCSEGVTLASVVQWALFPSPDYLRWVHKLRSSWLVLFYYPYRPLKFIVWQVFCFCRRHIPLYSRHPRQHATDLNNSVNSPWLRRIE